MPTSPPEILELAQFIPDRFLTEAGRRSAISRAYYAARHCTEAAFGTPAGAEHETSHTALIRAVREMGKAPGPARGEAAVIAQFLDVLRRRRNTADYRLDEEVERADVDRCFGHAESIMRSCGQAQEKLEAHKARVGAEPAEPPPRSPGSGGPPRGLKRVK